MAHPATHTGSKAKGKGGKAPRAPAAQNPLYDPSQPLSGLSLLDAARTQARLQTGPQLADLAQQETNTRANTAQLAGFAQRGSDAATAAAQRAQTTQAALSQALNDELAKIGSGVQGVIDKASSEATARTAADTALRGPGLGGGSEAQLAATLAAARTRAGTDEGAYRALGAQAGAGYQSLANERAATAPMRGQELLGRITSNAQGQLGRINQARVQAKQREGELTASNVFTLRQKEVENRLASAGLGLKQAGAETAAQQAERNYQLALQRVKDTETNNATDNERLQAKDDAAAAKDAFQRANGLGPYKPAKPAKGPKRPYTSTQKTAANEAYAKAQSLLNDPKAPKSFVKALQALVSQFSIPSSIARAAVEVKFNGGAQANTVRTVRKRYGLVVPSRSTATPTLPSPF